MKNKAFTLIELLVVIVIIGILATISTATFSNSMGKARDVQRINDISTVHKAILAYYTVYGSYPSTGNINNVFGDPTCTFINASDLSTSEWVPGIVPQFLEQLPQDPTGEDQTQSSLRDSRGTCYMYASEGTTFTLSAWGTIEGGPQETNFYSRAGFREGLGNRSDARGNLCNHVGIGGNGDDANDYYKHSYTISNRNCSW